MEADHCLAAAVLGGARRAVMCRVAGRLYGTTNSGYPPEESLLRAVQDLSGTADVARADQWQVWVLGRVLDPGRVGTRTDAAES
jgi:hypothetical protein